jgi:hypothetical protein
MNHPIEDEYAAKENTNTLPVAAQEKIIYGLSEALSDLSKRLEPILIPVDDATKSTRAQYWKKPVASCRGAREEQQQYFKVDRKSKIIARTARMLVKHKLLRHHYWDDSQAESYEWWALYEYRRGWFRWSWRPVKVDHYALNGMVYKDNATGDRQWAEKIAKHYGIEVPND